MPGNPIRLDYTRNAYHMLPRIDQPRILDVGCGRGDPTLELAKLSDGEIIGVDIDWWLDYFGPLEERIRELRKKYAGDQEAQQVLDAQQREVDLFTKCKKWYGSAFYVMQKRTQT